MALDGFSVFCSIQIFCRQILKAIATTILVYFLAGGYQPARAQTDSITIEIPVDGQVPYHDLMNQAEFLSTNTISREFSRDNSLMAVEVVILGNRLGEIIPILSTAVSRNQWQETPQASAWSQYYNASYALFQRHDLGVNTTIAQAPSRSDISNISAVQIDRALDERRLTGEQAQQYLDDLD